MFVYLHLLFHTNKDLGFEECLCQFVTFDVGGFMHSKCKKMCSFCNGIPVHFEGIYVPLDLHGTDSLVSEK